MNGELNDDVFFGVLGWVWYLIGGRFEVEEGFANEDAPAALRVAVFDFNQPALEGGFLVFHSAEEDASGVATDDVLQYPHPFFNGGARVGR